MSGEYHPARPRACPGGTPAQAGSLAFAGARLHRLRKGDLHEDFGFAFPDKGAQHVALGAEDDGDIVDLVDSEGNAVVLALAVGRRELGQGSPHHPARALNRRFLDYVRGWRAVAEHVGVYDYYGHFYMFTPWPLVHSIRRDLPLLKGLGSTAS
jgi:hypothetical protein